MSPPNLLHGQRWLISPTPRRNDDEPDFYAPFAQSTSGPASNNTYEHFPFDNDLANTDGSSTYPYDRWASPIQSMTPVSASMNVQLPGNTNNNPVASGYDSASPLTLDYDWNYHILQYAPNVFPPSQSTLHQQLSAQHTDVQVGSHTEGQSNGQQNQDTSSSNSSSSFSTPKFGSTNNDRSSTLNLPDLSVDSYIGYYTRIRQFLQSYQSLFTFDVNGLSNAAAEILEKAFSNIKQIDPAGLNTRINFMNTSNNHQEPLAAQENGHVTNSNASSEPKVKILDKEPLKVNTYDGTHKEGNHWNGRLNTNGNIVEMPEDKNVLHTGSLCKGTSSTTNKNVALKLSVTPQNPERRDKQNDIDVVSVAFRVYLGNFKISDKAQYAGRINCGEELVIQLSLPPGCTKIFIVTRASRPPSCFDRKLQTRPWSKINLTFELTMTNHLIKWERSYELVNKTTKSDSKSVQAKGDKKSFEEPENDDDVTEVTSTECNKKKRKRAKTEQ